MRPLRSMLPLTLGFTPPHFPQLLEAGFVAKSNFDFNDPDSAFNADKFFEEKVREAQS